MRLAQAALLFLRELPRSRVELFGREIGLLARALEKHPKMNASWTGEGIRLNPEINILSLIHISEPTRPY